MANKKVVFGILVILLVFGLSLSGCATYSTRGGVATPLGALTSANINASRTPIASYTIILGIITSGYEAFLEATKGKEIDIIDKNVLNIVRTISAVAKE